MKRKELKNLASKMAKCEMVIQSSTDPKAVKEAQEEVMRLSKCVDSIDDIIILDEMIQDILEKN